MALASVIINSESSYQFLKIIRFLQQIKQNKQMSERRSWTEEQDRALKYLKDTLQVKKWSDISRRLEFEFNLPGRNGKQCRERYTNHLDSSIISREFTQEDEQKLFKLHDEIGNKWSLISKQFKGRTDNHIKNHFHSKLRKAIRKLNKEIKQHYKKSVKPFKLTVIYKVVEASDYRFSDKLLLEEQNLNSFNELKNFLLQYAGGIIQKTTLFDMTVKEQALFLATKLQTFQKFFKNKKQSLKSGKSGSQSLPKIEKGVEQNDQTSNSENSSEVEKEIFIEEDEQSDCIYDDGSLQFIVQVNDVDTSFKSMDEETVNSNQERGQQNKTKQCQENTTGTNSFYSFSNGSKSINEQKKQYEQKSQILSIPHDLIEEGEIPSIKMSKKLSINSFDSMKEYDDSFNDSQMNLMLRRFDSYSDIEAGLFE